MFPQKMDLFINCPICNKIPYYSKLHGKMKCKTCCYYYFYFNENEIYFSIKFNRKNEIVYIDIRRYKNAQKYLYTIDFIPKNNPNYNSYNTYYTCIDKNLYNKDEFYLELDIFLNKKQINKIIDKVVSNQIFA